MPAPVRRAIVVVIADDWKSAYNKIDVYLPANYEVGTVTPTDKPHWFEVEVVGADVAGWTLDGYVIPRLASGLYHAEEV